MTDEISQSFLPSILPPDFVSISYLRYKIASPSHSLVIEQLIIHVYIDAIIEQSLPYMEGSVQLVISGLINYCTYSNVNCTSLFLIFFKYQLVDTQVKKRVERTQDVQ